LFAAKVKKLSNNSKYEIETIQNFLKKKRKYRIVIYFVNNP